MDGQASAINLRELGDRVERCSPECIYHHFIETQLRPTFDDPEFTNDFATWAYRALRDDVLAERLGTLDPFVTDSIDVLRAQMLEVLEERLSEVEHVPWTSSGHGFYFMRASMIVFDTGMRLNKPDDLLWALNQMTRPSIYYHFVEARSRHHGGTDDFTEWLRAGGKAGKSLAGSFSDLDVQLFSLRALRENLLNRAHQILGVGAGEP